MYTFIVHMSEKPHISSDYSGSFSHIINWELLSYHSRSKMIFMVLYSKKLKVLFYCTEEGTPQLPTYALVTITVEYNPYV